MSTIKGIIPAVFAACAAGSYIAFENKNLEITHHTVSSKKLPEAFDGLKAVCITDLHNNTFGKNNIRLIEAIDKFSPDMVLISGDMIVCHKAYFDTALSLLKALACRCPVFYGFGNHEEKYKTKYAGRYKSYICQIKEAGVIVLDNEYSYMSKAGDRIKITGFSVPEYVYEEKKLSYNGITIRKNSVMKAAAKSSLKNIISAEDINKCAGYADSDCFNILLAHTPVFFDKYAEWGADMVLSGHVHGGIARMPYLGGIISPQYELFPYYDAGIYQNNETVMYLSRGLGTHTIPVRAFNRPELMCLTFKKENQ